MDNSPLIRLIGGVRLNNGPVGVARKPLQVFTLLAVHSGQTVGTDCLGREIWGDETVVDYSAVLSVYASNLRKINGIDVKKGLNGGGYAMQIDPSQVDLLVFVNNRQQIRRLLEAGDLHEADQLLAINTELTVGPLFGDLKCGETLKNWKRIYNEHLAAMARDRFELRLRQGRHREIVTDLLLACSNRPYDEDLAAKLMLALYRCNQRLEVFEVYKRLNRAVREDLGVEVSQWVNKLYGFVLADDERLNDLDIQFSV